jgi:hypothetical protein
MRQRSGLLLLATVMLGGCTMLADMKCEYVYYATDAGPDAEPDAGPDAAVCTPGETRFCYTGPEGTEENQPCKKGTQVCDLEGSGFGLCMDEVKPGVELCSEDADENCDGADACTGTHLWSKNSDASQPVAEALSVAIDTAGNIVLAGYMNGSQGIKMGDSAFNHTGDGDIFVSKYDASGELLWTHLYDCVGGSGLGTSVSTDSMNNIVLTGNFQGTVKFGSESLESDGESDIFVVKLDAASGSPLWSEKIGGVNRQYAASVAIDHEDEIVLAGSFAQSLEIDGVLLNNNKAGFAIFVAKLDADGRRIWSRVFGGDAEQHSRDIAIDKSNNIFVVGHFRGNVDFGGVAHPSAGEEDVFIVKFDSSGDDIKHKYLGGTGSDYGLSVATDSSGNVVLAGDVANKVVVAKLDGVDLTDMGSTSFGDGVLDQATCVAIDDADNVLVTGYFDGSIEPYTPQAVMGRDIFLLKLDPKIKDIWVHSFGDVDNEQANSVATDSAGNVVLVGQFQGMIDFGDQPLMSAGTGDMFVAKFAP